MASRNAINYGGAYVVFTDGRSVDRTACRDGERSTASTHTDGSTPTVLKARGCPDQAGVQHRRPPRPGDGVISSVLIPLQAGARR
jgi:hypothetical protein